MKTKLAANVYVTIKGKEQKLRRALIVPNGDGYRVFDLTGNVLVKRSHSYSVRWAWDIERIVAQRKELLGCDRAVRRVRRAGVPITNRRWPSRQTWEALADLAEAGKIEAVDCSPKSESTYVAPTGADLSEANRGPDGAYSGWVCVAWHSRPAHQRCLAVGNASELLEFFAKEVQ